MRAYAVLMVVMLFLGPAYGQAPPNPDAVPPDFTGPDADDVIRASFDDFFMIADNVGTQQGDPVFHPAYDLDGSGRVDGPDVFILIENLFRTVDQFYIPSPPEPWLGPWSNDGVAFSLTTPAHPEGLGPSQTFDIGLYATGMVDVKELEVAVEWEPADALVAAQTQLVMPPEFGWQNDFLPFWPVTAFSPGHMEYFTVQVPGPSGFTGNAGLGTLTLTTSPTFSQSTPLTVRVSRIALGPELARQDVFEAGAGLDLEVTVTAPTIASLIQDVADLAAAGFLNQGQANALTQKLSNAARQLDKGNAGAAANLLGAFSNQVVAFMRIGKMPAAQGQALLEGAATIAAGLTEGTAKPVAAGLLPGSWGLVKAGAR